MTNTITPAYTKNLTVPVATIKGAVGWLVDDFKEDWARPWTARKLFRNITSYSAGFLFSQLCWGIATGATLGAGALPAAGVCGIMGYGVKKAAEHLCDVAIDTIQAVTDGNAPGIDDVIGISFPFFEP